MLRPYYSEAGITIYHRDYRDVLPQIGRVDTVFADPPYGVNKAEWDYDFSIGWFDLVAPLCQVLAITPGISNLLSLPRLIGDLLYRWTLSLRDEMVLEATAWDCA